MAEGETMIQIETERGVLEAEADGSGILIEYGYSTKGRWYISDLDAKKGKELTNLLAICRGEQDVWTYNWVHIRNQEGVLTVDFIGSGKGDPHHETRLTDTGRQQLIALIESVLQPE